jgi:hypothetical protein
VTGTVGYCGVLTSEPSSSSASLRCASAEPTCLAAQSPTDSAVLTGYSRALAGTPSAVRGYYRVLTGTPRGGLSRRTEDFTAAVRSSGYYRRVAAQRVAEHL